jgi:hypothetical protein
LGSSAPLPGCLIQHDGPGCGNVQRTDTPGHGDAQQVVAGAPDEIVQTGAFAAEDQNAVPGEVELVVVGGAALVETNDPNILPLEVFEGANKVDHARDAQVLGGSGAGLDRDWAERGRTPLGKNDAVDTCPVGYAQQRAEILRIFDTIERENETGRVGAGGIGREKVFEGECFLWPHESHDALVGGRASQLRELLARFLTDANTGLAALSDEAGEPLVVALASDQNVIETAAASLESLLYGMEAIENFHEGSLDCR